MEHTFKDEIGDPSLRGKTATFKVGVRQLQEKILPELDDEFAKDLDHESLDELRQKVRERLEETEGKRSRARLREALVDKLIDDNPVPVPPSMVNQQEAAQLQEYLHLQRLLGQALPFDEQTRASMRARAERKIQAGLLFRAIAGEQKIEVGDAEVEAKLEEIAQETGKHIAKVRAEHQGEAREELQARLLQERLLEYLESQATITDVSAEELAARSSSQADSDGAVAAEGKLTEETAGAGDQKKQASTKKATKKKAAAAKDDAGEGETKKAPAKQSSKAKKTQESDT